ncbi:aldehyde dehydrogenase [Candidatus Pelagibacter sp. IMCC9063]|uniref:aldehyde dehydrogenase family protein n=1 Tax=Pelagibacter sp. (strain IMCC9063) TaxID=1002672 RepID=UPI00020465B2|nr:aldehyde dehydrogenase family protein [Candidatus Pelagibacter sp. IMCC9063]AEA80652.1 aldehyde dehydrogenase [Candidatus Pelagibacter sp. IMCC9063]
MNQRVDALLKLCSRIEERAEEFALIDSYDAGNALTGMRKDVTMSIENIKYFCGLVREVKGETFSMEPKHLNFTRYQPYGVVLKINPFNHPFRFCVEKIAAPLLMGNSLVIKNSEQAPISPLKWCELLKDIFPDGLINVVTGGPEGGSFLVKHPLIKRIGVISSVNTGIAVNIDAAPYLKNVSLELGGKNPLMVFDDADPEFAADLAIKGMNLSRQGQSCSSTSRVLVHKSLKENFVKHLVEKAKKIPVGLPWIETNEIGPIVSKRQFDKVMEYIETGKKEGAKLVLGGDNPQDPELKNGFFINPTIFTDVKPDMTIAKEEIFGPVISVLTWESYEELIEIANSTLYGLTAMIATNSLSNAMKTAEDIQAGYVWVNTFGRYSGAPYGGWKLSGLGVEECFDEMKSYAKLKNINMKW